MVGWYWIGAQVEGSSPEQIWCIIPKFSLRDWGKPGMTSVMTTVWWTEIRNRAFLNANQKWVVTRPQISVFHIFTAVSPKIQFSIILGYVIKFIHFRFCRVYTYLIFPCMLNVHLNFWPPFWKKNRRIGSTCSVSVHPTYRYQASYS
jgi:hypothetical protein